MFKAKEIDINGVRLKSGYITSQKGATIQDQDGEITLSGTFTVPGDQSQMSHLSDIEQFEEELPALEMISDSFVSKL